MELPPKIDRKTLDILDKEMVINHFLSLQELYYRSMDELIKIKGFVERL